jgi:hypothetical protein
MPAGRPSGWTKERIAQVADLLLLAFSDEQIALMVGTSSKTIQRARLGEICPEIKIAELKREAVYRKKIWDAKGFWQGAAWFLERKYPLQFAKPEVQMNLNMQHNEVHQTLVISAEQAESLVSRVKAVGSQVDTLFKEKRAKSPNTNGNGHSNGHHHPKKPSIPEAENDA